jgi:signal peptidase II
MSARSAGDNPSRATSTVATAGAPSTGGVVPVVARRFVPLRAVHLLTLLAVVLAADQASKVYAINHWQSTASEPIEFLNGVFKLQYAENPGAFLSLFGTLNRTLRIGILTVANGIILCVLAGVLVTTIVGSRWQWTSLALIVSGGMGNLIDRIRFDGRVIDFLLLTSGSWDVPYFGTVRTGIFNIADIAITAGFVMWIPLLFRPGGTPVPDIRTPGATG